MEGLTVGPIRDAADRAAAMERIESLMTKDDPSVDEVRELEVLGILVAKFESERFPVGLPTPVEAIEFRMDQLGICRSELADVIGFPKSRISEVLNGKRTPSLEMMRSLHAELGIPAKVLLGAPTRKPSSKWRSRAAVGASAAV